MKVLVVATFSYPDHVGGAERVIWEGARRLVGRGHEVTLVTSAPDGDGAPVDERIDGVELRRYATERRSRVAFYRSVARGVRRRLLRVETPDVVHLHQTLSAAAAVAPGAVGDRPTVFTFHAPYHLEFLARHRAGRDTGRAPLAARATAALLRHADRYVLRHSDGVITLSEFARSQVAALDAAAAERTAVAPAGVDLERFRPARDEDERRAAAASFGLPTDVPLVVSVRRLVPRMGLPDLLDAAGALLERGVRVHVAIAGDGEQRAELERRAAELPAGVATLLGRVPDERLPELYRAASVFALPTRALEGFGMVTAEALASGLPVVATRVGANAEVLGRVEHAALVPASDPREFAGALEPLLLDADRRARAARAARAHALAHLDWDSHLDAFELVAQAARGGTR